uniref:ORF 5a protein n=2 Tax=Simian hemorrhagic fever virus TaxID=38143 RepID=A0A1L5YPP7_SHFV|nr:ORF5a protein [Simian hemorrhagic fever virus]APP93695.1 ORF 5a protein [Simian hemorrhagic fever virus]APP93708.1 ORF 5a protein [Simian hemorrhagic fever virus]APP93786.1 ORF 5a protein [Simian hemorrhagic fever virus]APP93799.1 ORF 5a protein [Simian hemorrhagic fever virus]
MFREIGDSVDRFVPHLIYIYLMVLCAFLCLYYIQQHRRIREQHRYDLDQHIKVSVIAAESDHKP